MPVTLQSIADHLGVSRSTVSLALRDDPRISTSRRKRIQEVAQELGYRPNALISSLMSHLRDSKNPPQRTGLLYLISGPDPSPGPPGTLFHTYYAGAAHHAARRGYHLEQLWVGDPQLTESRLEKILWARRIPGVIVGPQRGEGPLPTLPWDRLSAVMLGHPFPDSPLDRVSVNYYTSTRLALAFIKQTLRHPVRLILPALHDRKTNHLWVASYLQKRLRNRSLRAPFILESPRRAVEWVERNPQCTVLGTNLVRSWLQDAGLHDKTDFNFVSLSVEHYSDVTGVKEPTWEVGVETAGRLIDLISRNTTGIPTHPRMILVEPSWQEGKV